MTTLMIVDDHRHIVEDLATTISWSEHGVTRVLQAYSGPEALERLRKEPVDIVVTDIRMPVMSGLELIREIGAGGLQTDCLLLTGHAEFEYARQAVELGAAGYLMKPVRHEELVRSVVRVMNNRASRLAQIAEASRLRDTVQVELPRMRAELLAARSEAEQAAETERTRIVGDIHDIVGYTLTTMIVQLELIGKQLVADREAGIERLEQSKRFMHQSLGEIRETLGQLLLVEPGDGEEEPDDLASLIERFLQGAERAVCISIERRLSLPWPIDDPALIKALLNALQEGITNGVRHGGADVFRFSLEATEEEELRFELWNNGKRYDGANSGTGLYVMGERLGKLGGRAELSAASDPDGTLLVITIPTAGWMRADGA